MNGRLRWIGSFALVVASYAAAGTVLIAWKPNYETPELMAQPIVLLELEPMPAPPPPPQVIPPPPPPPEPEPEPLPKVELPKPEGVLPPPPPKKRPPPKKHEEPPPQIVQPEPAPAPPVKPPPPAAPQIAAAAAPSPSVISSYATLLYAHLNKNKRYPRGSQMRHEQGVAVVHLVIDRGGQLLDSKLVRPSGHEALDEEALALLHRAPLPPRPSDLGDKELAFDVPISFSLR